jgi:hypothetical protein
MSTPGKAKGSADVADSFWLSLDRPDAVRKFLQKPVKRGARQLSDSSTS